MQPPTRPISSWLVSSCIHVAVLALLLAAATVVVPPPIRSPRTTTIELHAPPLIAPRIQRPESGGGQGMPEPASKGRLPDKPTRRLFLPPTVAVTDNARLVMAVGMINAPDIDSALDAIG